MATTSITLSTPRPVHGSRLADVLPRVVLAAALGVVVWPALVHAMGVWSTVEEFSYGFLVPPMSVALLWWRRSQLRRSAGHGSTSGLLVVGLAIMTTLLARRADINALAGLAVGPLLLGSAAYLWGWRLTRVLLFPIGFLTSSLILFYGLLHPVGFALQGITARGAALIANGMGFPVVRDGLVLSSDRFAFIVAEQCSGMSSLVSLLSLAALWIYCARGSLPARLAVLLAAIPLVIVANTLRVTFVLAVAWWYGQDAAIGYFHGFSSLTLFGIALAGLLIVSRVVGCKANFVATRS